MTVPSDLHVAEITIYLRPRRRGIARRLPCSETLTDGGRRFDGWRRGDDGGANGRAGGRAATPSVVDQVDGKGGRADGGGIGASISGGGTEARRRPRPRVRKAGGGDVGVQEASGGTAQGKWPVFPCGVGNVGGGLK